MSAPLASHLRDGRAQGSTATASSLPAASRAVRGFEGSDGDHGVPDHRHEP